MHVWTCTLTGLCTCGCALSQAFAHVEVHSHMSLHVWTCTLTGLCTCGCSLSQACACVDVHSHRVCTCGRALSQECARVDVHSHRRVHVWTGSLTGVCTCGRALSQGCRCYPGQMRGCSAVRGCLIERACTNDVILLFPTAHKCLCGGISV